MKGLCRVAIAAGGLFFAISPIVLLLRSFSGAGWQDAGLRLKF